MGKAQQAQAVQANKKRREVDFTVGDHVYVAQKRPCYSLFDGNYERNVLRGMMPG